jgi:hypothetical protein
MSKISVEDDMYRSTVTVVELMLEVNDVLAVVLEKKMTRISGIGSRYIDSMYDRRWGN